MTWRNWFSMYTLDRKQRRDLADAELAAHEHEKGAEHHEALALMYRHRAERLRASLAVLAPDAVLALIEGYNGGATVADLQDALSDWQPAKVMAALQHLRERGRVRCADGVYTIVT